MTAVVMMRRRARLRRSGPVHGTGPDALGAAGDAGSSGDPDAAGGPDEPDDAGGSGGDGVFSVLMTS
ncbi:MAG: hypothetical protein ACHQ52_04910 [Candidatus Eisenbacteria bacterium]